MYKGKQMTESQRSGIEHVDEDLEPCTDCLENMVNRKFYRPGYAIFEWRRQPHSCIANLQARINKLEDAVDKLNLRTIGSQKVGW